MCSNRGDKIREMFFHTLDETIEAMRSAETLGFAYTVKSYTRMTSEDEGEGEWKLTLYEHWDVQEEPETESQ